MPGISKLTFMYYEHDVCTMKIHLYNYFFYAVFLSFIYESS